MMPPPRCPAEITTMLRGLAPAEEAEFSIGGVAYHAKIKHPPHVFWPSHFTHLVYTVEGDDGSRCTAEFVHVA